MLSQSQEVMYKRLNTKKAAAAVDIAGSIG
jgi:hypothetical protein